MIYSLFLLWSSEFKKICFYSSGTFNAKPDVGDRKDASFVFGADTGEVRKHIVVDAIFSKV